MTISNDASTYTAFDGTNLLVKGPLDEVVTRLKKMLGRAQNNPYLIFSDTTGKTMDFDLHGTDKDVLKRLQVFTSEAPVEAGGPGRPKLGVVSREISLLPRHWEWLAAEPGGASVTLRRLVEEAKKKTAGTSSIKSAQDRTYKVLTTLAGDFAGFEEALRSLYRKEEKKFLEYIASWPKDVRVYAIELSKPVFAG